MDGGKWATNLPTMGELMDRIEKDRPPFPRSWRKNPRQWLSNVDIDRELASYARHIRNLEVIKATSMDFAEPGVSRLRTLRLADLRKRGKDALAVVINTDYSDGPGEHWVCVWVDLSPTIERVVYWDSYAQPPEPEIRAWMFKLNQEWETLTHHSLRCEYNSLRHQHKNSECGAYSLLFLHCCIFSVPLNVPVPDDVVVQLRRSLFVSP